MNNVVRVGALIAAGVLFVVFLYLVLNAASEGQYITVAVMFVFSVLATRLDDIEKLNFGATGVAADLSRKLKEAQATIVQLQTIAEVFARLSITQISSSNRWGGLSAKEKRELIDAVAEGLKAIDLSGERITSVLEGQFRYDDFDYYYWTMEGIVHSSAGPVVAKREEFNSLFPEPNIGNNPAPELVENFFNDNDWNQGENAERLADWKYYRATRNHRRRVTWEARHDSGKITDLDDLLAGQTSPQTNG